MAEPRGLLSGTTELAATNTAQQLTTESLVTVSLLVTALKANAENVKIGPSTVGATSYALEPAESVQFDFIDPSRVYLYGKEKDNVKYIGLIP